MKNKYTIFHFNCPVCGSHEPEQDLMLFLDKWRNITKESVDYLFLIFGHALEEASEQKNLKKELATLIRRETSLVKSIVPKVKYNKKVKLLMKDKKDCLVALFKCPLCNVSAGERISDRYFTTWSCAKAVQIANVLYEIGIIIFAIGSSLPEWASIKYLRTLKMILEVNREIQEKIDLMECPFCRRFTTCLYGDGSENNPQRCRWCLDRAGGISIIEIKFSFKKDFDDNFKDHLEAYIRGDINKTELGIHLDQHLDIHVPKGIPDQMAPEDIVPKPQKNPNTENTKNRL